MDDKTPTEWKNFTGTENWYKHPLFPNLLYTDGVRYIAQNEGAYWLLEKIFALQLKPELQEQSFQTWELKVSDDGWATLTAEDGDYTPIYTEKIDYTDFPEYGVRFFFTDKVLLLPSEY